MEEVHEADVKGVAELIKKYPESRDEIKNLVTRFLDNGCILGNQYDGLFSGEYRDIKAAIDKL